MLRLDFVVPHVVEFLKEQGRMKFVRPLYRDLFSWKEQSKVIETLPWPICNRLQQKNLSKWKLMNH